MDKSTLAVIFIMLSFFMGMVMLYNRKKSWCTPALRWILAGAFLLAGLLFLLTDFFDTRSRLVFAISWIPFIHNAVDRLFKWISLRKHGRDFYLYLRFSGEINYRPGASNPHIKPSDIFFSLFLLFMDVGLLLLSAWLFRS
jgi:hypothetical protein